MNKHAGFTLVEISIVLVIIGLILGAVFVGGQTLIANTKTTGTISLIKDLSGAVADFKNRYHYLPGDLPNAHEDISGIVSGTNCDKGNGNGLIDNPTNEIPCVAQHLVLAGFIKGSPTGIVSPLNAGTLPDVFVMWVNKSQVFLNVSPNPFSPTVQNVIEIRGIPCDAAIAIDNKIDDGFTYSGNVMTYPLCQPVPPSTVPVPPSTITTLDVGL